MVGFNPVGDIAVATLDDETPGNLPAVQLAAQNPVGDNCYLISIQAYQPGQQSTPWIQMIGQDPVAALPDGEEGSVGTTTFYFSDQPYITKPTESLANTEFWPRATTPLSIDRMMPVDPTGDRRLSVNIGAIELINDDGALDTLVQNYAIDGRPVVVRFGKRTDPYANFGIIFSGVATAWQADDGVVRIGLRDNGFLIETPLQALYTGAGGINGTAANTGKPVPQTYGKCRNISPVQIDPTNFVYQFHDRLVAGVDAVRDQGAALTLDATVGTGGDVADYSALIAATIVAGRYITCLALGLIRTQAKPTQLTADVRGDAQGGYISDTGSIAKRLMMDRASITAGQLNLGSFASITSSIPGVVGFYFTEAMLVAEAVSTVMSGIAGWWGANRLGYLTIGRLTAPSGSPSWSFDTVTIIRQPDRVELPDSIAPCVFRVTASYQKNWTVQQSADLVITVTADNRNIWGAPYQVSTPVVDSARRLRNLLARDVLIETYFDQASDAAAISQSLFSVYAPGRAWLDIPLKTFGHLVDLGETEQIIWPRYGLDAGLSMIVTGIREEAAPREVTLRVFG